MISADGDIYKGTFRNGMFHGKRNAYGPTETCTTGSGGTVPKMDGVHFDGHPMGSFIEGTGKKVKCMATEIHRGRNRTRAGMKLGSVIQVSFVTTNGTMEC